MKKTLIALVAAATLSGCVTTQSSAPDMNIAAQTYSTPELMKPTYAVPGDIILEAGMAVMAETITLSQTTDFNMSGYYASPGKYIKTGETTYHDVYKPIDGASINDLATSYNGVDLLVNKKSGIMCIDVGGMFDTNLQCSQGAKSSKNDRLFNDNTIYHTLTLDAIDGDVLTVSYTTHDGSNASKANAKPYQYQVFGKLAGQDSKIHVKDAVIEFLEIEEDRIRYQVLEDMKMK